MDRKQPRKEALIIIDTDMAGRADAFNPAEMLLAIRQDARLIGPATAALAAKIEAQPARLRSRPDGYGTQHQAEKETANSSSGANNPGLTG